MKRKTKEPGPVYVHRLHALDIATGLERTNFNSPVIITATNYPGMGDPALGDNDGNGHVLWNPLMQHLRCALALVNGSVYLAYGSHGDHVPYHGWVFGYSATNLARQLSVYNCTPNGADGGFWNGGSTFAVDSAGNMYLQSGNGAFNGSTNITATNNYSMSILKFSTTNGLRLADYFAPSNAVALSDRDMDLGSGGVIVLPDSAGSTAHPHLLVGGGKTPPIYVVDRDNLGRFNGTNGTNRIVQQFNASATYRDTTPAFFNKTMYVSDASARIAAFTLANGAFNPVPVETPDVFYNKGGTTVTVSANGTKNGIVWGIAYPGEGGLTYPAVLRAYNAADLTQELYTSDSLPDRDSAGDAVKFTVPTVANGKVYVGAQYSLTVYGLASGFVDPPVISPGGGALAGTTIVSMSNSTPGSSIHYTLNGSTPTTNSPLYVSPLLMTTPGSITAVGFKPGNVPSPPAVASFITDSIIGDGTGLLGQYWSNTLVYGFDDTVQNVPSSLIRTDAVVNFNWGLTGPGGNINGNNFITRWTGMVEPQFSETYTFWVTTDDGLRLHVNGQLLIDEWLSEPPVLLSGSIPLLAGQRYNIEMDYYHTTSKSTMQLAWSSPSTGLPVVIPQSQLHPMTNPPPTARITWPTNGTVITTPGAINLTVDTTATYNPIGQVTWYANGAPVGVVSNAPFSLSVPITSIGAYEFSAVAADTTGLATTTVPVRILYAPTGSYYITGGAFKNSAFQVSLMAPVGPQYILQASSNLVQWTSLNTNTPVTSPFVLSETNPPGKSRYYRVLVKP